MELGNEKFDIIFLDPPYNKDFGREAIRIIMGKELLKEDGIMVFETDREEEYTNSIHEFVNVIDIRKYGRVKLIFLGRKEKI